MVKKAGEREVGGNFMFESISTPQNFANSELQSLTVGQQLRQAREELGLTYRDLSGITKIQSALLAYLEEEKRVLRKKGATA